MKIKAKNGIIELKQGDKVRLDDDTIVEVKHPLQFGYTVTTDNDRISPARIIEVVQNVIKVVGILDTLFEYVAQTAIYKSVKAYFKRKP